VFSGGRGGKGYLALMYKFMSAALWSMSAVITTLMSNETADEKKKGEQESSNRTRQ